MKPKRRIRRRAVSVETLAASLPDELLDPDTEPRDRLPRIGDWLRAHMVDPGLAFDVANAAGVGPVDWFRHKLSDRAAADDHHVYQTVHDAAAEQRQPTRQHRKPDLRVVK